MDAVRTFTQALSAALLVTLVSCEATNANVFTCTMNGQCNSGESTGVCEANGRCSFQDLTCDSGRRFGSLASELANQCVVVDTSGTSGLSLTDGDADSEQTSELPTTEPGPIGTPTGTTDSDADSDIDSDMPSACLEESISDAFEGNSLEAGWSTFAPSGWPLLVENGLVRLGIGNDVTSQVGFERTLLGFTNGRLEVQVATLPTEATQQFVLSIGLQEAHVLLYRGNGQLQYSADGQQTLNGSITPPDTGEIAFAIDVPSEGAVSYEYRLPNEEWTVAATLPRVFSAGDTPIAISAGSFQVQNEAQWVEVEHVDICFK